MRAGDGYDEWNMQGDSTALANPGRMRRWRTTAVVVTTGLVVHLVVILVLIGSKIHPPMAGGNLETTTWIVALLRPERPAATVHPSRELPPQVKSRRPLPSVVSLPAVVEPRAIQVAPAASPTPQPPASQASAPQAPLRLRLTPGDLRALEDEHQTTLAVSAARQLRDGQSSHGGDDDYERDLPHGVTEVHSHGQCFRLVAPSMGVADPFNHGGQRLTAPCT
jgi:hypothetical protein